MGRYLLALGVAASAVALVVVVALALFGVLGEGEEPRPPAGAVAQGDDASDDVVEQVRPGLVLVSAVRGGRRVTGAGFAVDSNGHVLTALSVVSGARRLRLQAEGADGAMDAEVSGVDRSSGLAVLEIGREDAAALEPLQAADPRRLRLGDPVLAVGTPFGLRATVSAGVVSGLGRSAAIGRRRVDGLVETDALVNRGNIGGPLVSGDGRVVGVLVRGGRGRGLAVPADTAYQVAELVEETGRGVRAGSAGLTSVALDPGLAGVIGLTVEHGLLVTSVEAGGPADRAGLRAARADGTAGDVITSVDGDLVRRPRDLVTALLDRRPGSRVTLELTRGRRELRRTIRLGR